MERRQLEELSEMELRSYFVRNNLAIPKDRSNKDELIESILQHQAGTLVQLAHKAHQMLRNPVWNGGVPVSSVASPPVASSTSGKTSTTATHTASVSVTEEPMEVAVRQVRRREIM